MIRSRPKRGAALHLTEYDLAELAWGRKAEQSAPLGAEEPDDKVRGRVETSNIGSATSTAAGRTEVRPSLTCGRRRPSKFWLPKRSRVSLFSNQRCIGVVPWRLAMHVPVRVRGRSG